MSHTGECLPSGDAAIDLFRAPSLPNAGKVVGTFALRGLLVAGGLYLAGARGKPLLGYSAAATGAIEVFVLGWAWWCTSRDHRSAARETRKRNPLRRGTSDATFHSNVAMLRREGRPRKQALAIAYKKRRESGWRG